MKYSTKQRFTGDAAAAISAVETVLLPNGFVIVDKKDRSIEVTGRAMNSTKENPLKGATRIRVESKGGHLHLDAELGGVKRMAFFVCLFPTLLFVGLAFIPPLLSGEGVAGIEFGVLYGTGIWVVVGPLMAGWMRKRAAGALDDLLTNAVTLGSQK